MDLTVVVATFGDNHWRTLALERAVPSAQHQASFVHAHGETLAGARNKGLEQVETEWVIHLDADDELSPGYVEAMAKGRADVRGPMACYISGKTASLWQPRVYGHTHDCTGECLPDGNWLLIGSAVRTELLRRAGGWRDFAWSEDWSTWLRCYRLGATFELIPDAIYRAHVRPDSRNRGASQEVKLAAHRAIYEDAFAQAE